MTADTHAEAAQSKPFWVKCGNCSHKWIGAYYPMDIRKFAKIAMSHSTCPKCGSEDSLVAKQNFGDLQEP